jgi:hypothetical protein
MQLTRLVLLGVAGGAIVVWAAAAATSPSPQTAPTPPRVAQAPADSASLQSEIARLHERLRPDTTPLQQRDLFRYGGAPARTTPMVAAPADQVTLAPAPIVPPAPVYKLIGLAEDQTADAVVRTAIISGRGEVFVVKVGDRVGDRYRVSRIAADVVELVDDSGSAPLRLPLP